MCRAAHSFARDRPRTTRHTRRPRASGHARSIVSRDTISILLPHRSPPRRGRRDRRGCVGICRDRVPLGRGSRPVQQNPRVSPHARAVIVLPCRSAARPVGHVSAAERRNRPISQELTCSTTWNSIRGSTTPTSRAARFLRRANRWQPSRSDLVRRAILNSSATPHGTTCARRNIGRRRFPWFDPQVGIVAVPRPAAARRSGTELFDIGAPAGVSWRPRRLRLGWDVREGRSRPDRRLPQMNQNSKPRGYG
jgi:hypothetical protein